jgi:hypothetical protein
MHTVTKKVIGFFVRFRALASFSLVFSGGSRIITIEVIEEIAQPTVNPGTIQMCKEAL